MSICDTPARGTGSEPNVVSPKQCAARLVKQRRGSDADSVAARALSEPAWSHIGQPQLHVSVVSGYATQSCYATPNL